MDSWWKQAQSWNHQTSIAFSSGYMEILDRYVLGTQILQSGLEKSWAFNDYPKTDWCRRGKPSPKSRRTFNDIEGMVCWLEKLKIFNGDIDLQDYYHFLTVETCKIIAHIRLLPKTWYESFMSSFEDLLSMRTQAFLIKDIDPEILQNAGYEALLQNSMSHNYKYAKIIPIDNTIHVTHGSTEENLNKIGTILAYRSIKRYRTWRYSSWIEVSKARSCSQNSGDWIKLIGW